MSNVQWRYGGEGGFWESRCGRFTISPEYQGTTRPQSFKLWDNGHAGKERRGCGSFDTVRDAKATAGDIRFSEQQAVAAKVRIEHAAQIRAERAARHDPSSG